MVPMCTLGCALAVKFVAILSGQRSIIQGWHWAELNSLLWISKFWLDAIQTTKLNDMYTLWAWYRINTIQTSTILK